MVANEGVRQLVYVAHRLERALLDELALDSTLGPTTDRSSMVAYAVRSGTLEVLAVFAERVSSRTGLTDAQTTLCSADVFRIALRQEMAAVGTDMVQSDLEPDAVIAEAEAALMRAKLNGGNRAQRVALQPTSVTIVAAATLLGVTAREVIALIGKGELKAIRRGRHVHIDRAGIEAYRAHS